MQLFADTADTKVLAELMETGLIDGVTTNPTIIAKSGRNMFEVIKEICDLLPGPISAEVVSNDAKNMILEGEKLGKIATNVVVKVPLTSEGLKASKELSAQGLMTNVTLCFSVSQALLAAKAGASFVSPFIGRLDDHGADGMQLIADIRALYDIHKVNTKILAASVRTPKQVADAALAGATCATLPPQIFKDMFSHPLTAAGLNAFMVDWASTGQSIL